MRLDLNKIVLGVIVITIVYLAILTVLPFFSSLFFAFVTAYALEPVHKKLSKRVGTKNSALFLTLAVIITASVFSMILIYTLTPVVKQAYMYLSDIESWIKGLPIPQGLLEGSVESMITQAIEKGKEYLINLTFSVPRYVLQTIVYLAFVYFFLLKRDAIVDLLTFEDERLMKIIARGNLTLQALIRAWLLLNIAKGVLMTVGFLIFRVSNVPTAILAGLLTILFSFVPLFEGWMIWVVGSFYLLREGHLLLALGLAVYGFTLVSPLPDFTIRPKLVAREANFDETIVLIGMIGGTWGLGLKGLIIGPIVLNVALEMLKEWKKITSSQQS
ncbi:AI-2E family transporter [Pyrococcus sp. ST04]|uniref:AI-2E family transporter n=1 Tax=Pyrococcus sp. ST04 TaxID=1183377 RepID=UPI0002605C8C|nr:AI-2E family transporter [Pyrococcus sp. ST04]AFK22388.1 putative permease [Pyrococcus sp. ST04]